MFAQQMVGIAGQFDAQFLLDLDGERGFHVIDAYFGFFREFCQFGAQELRGQMFGSGGQGFHVRGKRGFGDEVAQGKGQCVAKFPPAFTGARVAGIGQIACAVILPQDEARGGLGVVDGPGGHGDVADDDRNPGRHRGVGQHRGFLGDDGEVRPDGVVQEMFGNGVEDCGQAVDGHGRPVLGGEELDEVVGQKQDVLDMVEMGVGDENMFDAGLGGQIEGGGDGAGIEEDGVVDEKRGEMLSWEIGAGTAEYAQVHTSLLVAGDARGPNSLSRAWSFVKGGLDRKQWLV